MSIRVKWVDPDDDPVEVQFEISDAVKVALNQYRLTQTELQPDGTFTPIFASVREMLIEAPVASVVKPALSMFPTSAIAAAKLLHDATTKDLDDLYNNAIPVVEGT